MVSIEQWPPHVLRECSDARSCERVEHQMPFLSSSWKSDPLVMEPDAFVAQEQPTSNKAGLIDPNIKRIDAITEDRVWSPFVLRRKVVWSFFATICILLVLLCTLQGISASHEGLVNVDTANYYLWTYGPTITFVILSTLWGQIEARTLQLLPWHLMSRGFVSASDSVLLDYISMWNVFALFKSIKRRHFVVTLAVGISLTIKLLIAFSTSLFIANPVEVTTEVEFSLGTEFADSAFNASAVDSAAYLKSWGVLQRGLSHPLGTSNDHAFQVVHSQRLDKDGSPIYSEGQKYMFDAEVITLWLDCEAATVITSSSTTDITLQSSSCRHFPRSSSNQFWPQEVIVAVAPCNPKSSGKSGNRLWASLAIETDSSNGQLVPEREERNGTTSGALYVDFVSVMCTPQYNVSRGLVTLAGNSDNYHPIPTVTNIQRNATSTLNVTASDLLTAAYNSVDRASSSSSLSDQARWLLLGIDPGTISVLFRRDLLEQRLSQNMNSIMAQIINQYLTRQSTSQTKGTIVSAGNRLMLQKTTVIVVGVLLAIVAALILVFILVYLPFTACPRDPGSIGGLATLLSGSHDFISSLAGTGASSKRFIYNLLSDHHYTTATITGVFYIKPKINQPHRSLVDTSCSWWKPSSTSSWTYVTIVLLPVLILCILEALFQRSSTAQGLGNASKNLFVNLLPGLLPALALLGVRSLFEVIHFSARVFEPYSRLKKGRAAPAPSIWDNHHRSIAAFGLWHAVRKRQWAVVASAVAVLLGPVLAIVVASLFTIHPTTIQRGSSVTQLNQLNISDGLLWFATSSGDTWLGDLILEFNASYPTWTYKEWSFPRVAVMQRDMTELNTVRGNTTLNDTFITTRLPAIRIDLGCEKLTPDSVAIAMDPTPGDKTANVFTYSVNLTSLPNLTASECGYGDGDITIPNIGASSYFDGWNTSPDTYALADEMTPDACPAFFGVFGRTSPETFGVDDISVVACRPRVEQTDFNVRLRLPDYHFDAAFPPISIAETTVILWDKFFDGTNVSSKSGNATEWEKRAPELVCRGPEDLLEQYFIDVDIKDPKMQHLSRALRSVIYGVNATTPEALLDADTLISSLNRNIGILTAQIINSFGRETSPDNTTEARASRPTYPATINYPSDPRVVQQRTTTRVLQSILAVMSLCGLISVLLMDTRAVLPKNPLSIAARASLLADSKLMRVTNDDPNRRIPTISVDSQKYNDKELEQRDTFAGRTYSMGWWNPDGSRLEDAEVASDTRSGWAFKWLTVIPKLPASIRQMQKRQRYHATKKRNDNVTVEETELMDTTNPPHTRTEYARTTIPRKARVYFAIDTDD